MRVITYEMDADGWLTTRWVSVGDDGRVVIEREIRAKVKASANPTEPDIDKENEVQMWRNVPEERECSRCGRVVPLNSQDLCYPCWVLVEIINRERSEGRNWKPGDPHPDWCHCTIPGQHINRDGSPNGLN